MSPTKRPSAVAGLKRGLGGSQAGTTETDATVSPVLPTRAKPVRVTLDLDQETYTALNQWLGSAAAEVGAPVSKARALRAMIRAVALDKSVGLVVVDLLRRDS
jgi:hypothetical protein